MALITFTDARQLVSGRDDDPVAVECMADSGKVYLSDTADVSDASLALTPGDSVVWDAGRPLYAAAAGTNVGKVRLTRNGGAPSRLTGASAELIASGEALDAIGAGEGAGGAAVDVRAWRSLLLEVAFRVPGAPATPPDAHVKLTLADDLDAPGTSLATPLTRWTWSIVHCGDNRPRSLAARIPVTAARALLATDSYVGASFEWMLYGYPGDVDPVTWQWSAYTPPEDDGPFSGAASVVSLNETEVHDQYPGFGVPGMRAFKVTLAAGATAKWMIDSRDGPATLAAFVDSAVTTGVDVSVHPYSTIAGWGGRLAGFTVPPAAAFSSGQVDWTCPRHAVYLQLRNRDSVNRTISVANTFRGG